MLLNTLNFDHPLFQNGYFTPGRLSKKPPRITGLGLCKWIASCTVVEVILWEHIDNGSFISYSHLQTQPGERKIRCSYSLHVLGTTIVSWQLQVLAIRHTSFLYLLLFIYVTYTKMSLGNHLVKRPNSCRCALDHKQCRTLAVAYLL